MKNLAKSWQSTCLSVAVLVIPLSLVPILAVAAETDRITVEDPSTGNVKFKVTSDGNVIAGSILAGSSNIVLTAEGKLGVGTASPVEPVEIVTGLTNPKMRFSNTLSTGAGEMVFYEGATYAGGLSAFGATYGADGSAAATWRNALVLSAAKPNTGKIIFRTKTGTSYSERLLIDNSGNIGVGTSAPSQKLEVNGGVRINTATAQPGCTSNARGTFWVTQKGAGVMDTVEVCVKNASEAYVWKPVW